MKKLFLVPKLAVAAALVVCALAIPASSRASFGGGGSGCPHGGFCTENYDPVICSNGVVYSNACFASLACATGCVPYGNAS